MIAYICAGMALTAVLRGGSWNNNDTNCRAAYRNRNHRNNRNNNMGFRLARTAQNEARTQAFCTGTDYAVRPG
jgi:Uncharacterized conserved protein